MIGRISSYTSKTMDPYQNLAIEEYLTFHTKPDECILFLWQNEHTVVIGRNQNCWKECGVTELEKDGGHLARRLSGGGAVYHDRGNLNFTFCLRKENANVEKQLQVIIDAVAVFGLRAELNGRNDIVLDGQKFSGNAFYDSGDYYYHHGTLLIDVDIASMSRFLHPSKAKLESRGVASVRSRVTNLSSLCAEITTESMKTAMVDSFSYVYGKKMETFDETRLDWDEMGRLRERFASREWKYGRKIPFTDRFGRRFDWGEVELALKVNGGIVEEALLSSDSMEAEWFDGVDAQLAGCLYEAEALCGVLERILAERNVPETVRAEVSAMVRGNLLS
ncbi:MAG: lipoate--protein ligase [Clostridiales bacterium]|nr:lipoate--protein ligase [Clostridiales bacterium]